VSYKKGQKKSKEIRIFRDEGSIYLFLTINFLFYFVELDDDNTIDKDDGNL
jgi:hypothetical protein